jgi:uncharacterized membrane protein (UPF0136 family)
LEKAERRLRPILSTRLQRFACAPSWFAATHRLSPKAAMLSYADIVLWIYIVLLVAGGLVGFLKANSKMSLIMSVAFATPLALSLLLHWPTQLNLGLLGFLSVFFGLRYAKGRKFMPAGLMTALSVATLALQYWLR